MFFEIYDNFFNFFFTSMGGWLQRTKGKPALIRVPLAGSLDRLHWAKPLWSLGACPDALLDTPEPIPAMFQVQGSPTPTSPPRQGHLAVPNPPTTLSAPSSVQSLRPQRHRKTNVRLDPAEWELGKMDTA